MTLPFCTCVCCLHASMCVSDIQLSRVLSIANINIFCLVFPTNCLVRWITSNHLIHWLKVKPPIKGTEVFLIEYLLPFFDIACWHTHTHTFPPPPLHTHTHTTRWRWKSVCGEMSCSWRSKLWQCFLFKCINVPISCFSSLELK